MTTLWWVLAVAMIAIGIVGTVLPVLPGVVFVFGGIWLGAWTDGYERIPVWLVVALGVLTAVAVVIDYVAAALTAQRVGASRLGMLGAAVGTIAGIFMGIVGIIFMPLIGAAVGEFVAQRDALRAGKIGLATWLGLLIGTVVKLAIVFGMVGVFAAALLLSSLRA